MNLFANLRTVVVAAFAASLLLVAHAAGYPERTITIVVPFPPGSSTDSLARAVAERLGKELSQTVIVENRPGASTTIGTMAAKRAAPDGHTLLVQTDGFYSGVYAVKGVRYTPNDFVPVSALARTPFALVAPASIPSSSLEEYVRYARANPEKMNHGVVGSGLTIYKVMSDLLKKSTNTSWTDIPYKGGMEGIQAIMAGEIQGHFATISAAASQQKQTNLKILAVTDRRRSPYLPDVPTFKEAGYPEMVAGSSYALAVRTETSPEIQNKLKAAMRRVMESEDMKKMISTLSLEVYDGSLENYIVEGRERSKRYADMGYVPQ